MLNVSVLWCYLVQIGANTIVAPLGALSLSLLGLAWAFDIDELHKEQVKDKVNY